MTAHDAPAVSVVIPTYRRPAVTMRALDALAAQTLPPDRFEVIVVDDGSGDETVDLLAARRDPFRLRVEVHPTNRGPAAARNTGLRLAEAPAVAFTDSDCQPAPGWLEAGLAALADASVVQGRTLPNPDDPPPTGWCHTRSIESLSGFYETANMFFRTEDLRAAGGFDEVVGNFGEDLAGAYRVLRRGGTAAFCADALVYHDVAPSDWRWFMRWARLFANWPLVAARYPEVRDRIFWKRWFLRRRSAALVLAVVGVVLSPWRRAAILATVPYLAAVRPRSLRPGELAELGRRVAYDAAVEAALVRGSLRHRSLVL